MNNKNQKDKKVSFLSELAFLLTKEKDYFLENLTMMIGSGMDLMGALSAIEEEVKTTKMKLVISNLKYDISQGEPLWRSLEKTGLLNNRMIGLVRVGEESGRLGENLRLLGEQRKKESFFLSQIKSAMLYPLIVLFLTVVVGVTILSFVIPKLGMVFEQLKVDIPPITKFMLDTGNFLALNGLWFYPLVLAIMAMFVYLVFINKWTRKYGLAIFFRLPGTSKLIHEIELARFGYLLGSVLEAGMPLLESFDSTIEASISPGFKTYLILLRKSISRGNTFAESFIKLRKTNKFLDGPVQQLIISGENSGNLSQTLKYIGENFSKKVQFTTKDLTVMFESIILFIVWLGVVTLAISVIFPIYNLIGSLDMDPGLNKQTTKTIRMPK